MVIRRAVLPLVGLLLALAGAVDLEDARGVSAEDKTALISALEAALQRAGAGPTGPSVRVRLLGVPTRIRVIAERGGLESTRAEVDLPRDRAAWPALLDTMAQTLVPRRSPPISPPGTAPPPPRLAEPPTLAAVPPAAPRRLAEPTAVSPVVPPPPLAEPTAGLPGAPPPPPPLTVLPVAPAPETPPSASLAPWLVGAAGVVALGVGVGFGVSSRSARSSAADAPHSALELGALESRAVEHGWVANVSFGAAALSAVTSAVLFLVD